MLINIPYLQITKMMFILMYLFLLGWTTKSPFMFSISGKYEYIKKHHCDIYIYVNLNIKLLYLLKNSETKRNIQFFMNSSRFLLKWTWLCFKMRSILNYSIQQVNLPLLGTQFLIILFLFCNLIIEILLYVKLWDFIIF